jgi:hypothetical protein
MVMAAALVRPKIRLRRYEKAFFGVERLAIHQIIEQFCDRNLDGRADTSNDKTRVGHSATARGDDGATIVKQWCDDVKGYESL